MKILSTQAGESSAGGLIPVQPESSATLLVICTWQVQEGIVQLTLAGPVADAEQVVPVLTVTDGDPGLVTVPPAPGVMLPMVHVVVNVPPLPRAPKVTEPPGRHSSVSVPPVIGTVPFVTVIVKVLLVSAQLVELTQLFVTATVGRGGIVQLTLAGPVADPEHPAVVLTVTDGDPELVTVEPAVPEMVQVVEKVPPAARAPNVADPPGRQSSVSVPPVIGTEPFVTVKVNVIPVASQLVALLQVFVTATVGLGGTEQVALELAVTAVPVNCPVALTVAVSVVLDPGVPA